MKIKKIAAFSDKNKGGNPAGVAIVDQMPSPETMQKIAADIGFSETAFAVQQRDPSQWRVKYFTPENEIAFCGHATIALGAVLTKEHGEQQYSLELNQTNITVDGYKKDGGYWAALQSPPTHSRLMTVDELNKTLSLFNLSENQLLHSIPPARINAGVEHLLLTLNNRKDLANMRYELDKGREFMREQQVVTVMLVYQESLGLFHARNAFASAGVYEDPATGAAGAAFTGYLRDTASTKQSNITLIQGEDMGARSVINAEFGNNKGASIRISGATHEIISAS